VASNDVAKHFKRFTRQVSKFQADVWRARTHHQSIHSSAGDDAPLSRTTRWNCVTRHLFEWKVLQGEKHLAVLDRAGGRHTDACATAVYVHLPR
jgi:hypothetical protein